MSASGFVRITIHMEADLWARLRAAADAEDRDPWHQARYILRRELADVEIDPKDGD